MVFPTSNLPAASVPWAREIEKQLSTATITIKSNELNNAARDSQLASSLTRVNAAATQAQTAINSVISVEEAIYYPGTTEIDGGNIRANTIAANAISAGTLTGFTIQTASSGTRVVMGGSTIDFYYGSTQVGTLSGTGVYGAETSLLYPGTSIGIYVNNSSARLDATNSYVQAANAVARLSGGGNMVYADSFGTHVTGTLEVMSGITGYGGLSVSNTVAGNFLRTDNYAGGGTTGASINNNGTVIRTSSSSRYKQDIFATEYVYEDILNLTPKKFRLKDEVIDDENARYYAGFIAEDIAGTSLDIFVAYQTLDDGSKRPDGVYYAELTSALLSAIKHQDLLIKSLDSRLNTLEGK